MMNGCHAVSFPYRYHLPQSDGLKFANSNGSFRKPQAAVLKIDCIYGAMGRPKGVWGDRIDLNGKSIRIF